MNAEENQINLNECYCIGLVLLVQTASFIFTEGENVDFGISEEKI